MIADEYDGGWVTKWCPRPPEGWGWWIVTVWDELIVAEAHLEYAWLIYTRGNE